MILKGLRVESLGCFYEPIELSFAEGLNIIIGNNETGKSTLITALHHALFSPYTSQAQEIKVLKPWGTELSPKVEVEFEIEDKRYRVEKRFLFDPECRLWEEREGKWRLIAERDQADEQVRSFLLAEKPARGAAKSADRGIARLLWLPQGETLSFEVDGTLRNRIEACLGVATLDEIESQVDGAIQAKYAEIWTKRQKFTTGSGLPALEASIMELEEECRKLERIIKEVEQYGRDLEQVRDQIGILAKEQENIRAQRDAKADEVDEVARLRHGLEKAKEQLNSWQKAFELADDRRRRFREAEKTRTQSRENLDTVAEQLAASTQRMEELKEQRTHVKGLLKEALAAREKLESELARARALNQAKDKQDKLVAMEKRQQTVDRLASEIDARKKEVAEMPSPTSQDVAKGQKLERSIERQMGRLESVGLSLSFKAYSSQSGKVERDGEDQESFALLPEETVAFKAAQKAKLVLDGVGELDIQSGAEEVADLQVSLEKEREELQSLLAPFGASTSADLERLRLKKLQAQKELDELLKRMEQHLEAGESPDTLRALVAAKKRELEALCVKLTICEGDLAQLDRVELGPLEKEQLDLRRQEAKLRTRENTLDASIEEEENTQGEHEREKIELEVQMGQAQKTITELINIAGSKEAIENDYQTARREREAAREQVAELEANLPQPEDDPEALVARLTQELEDIGKVIRELEDRGLTLKANIQRVAEQGTYAELVRAQERLEASRQDYVQRIRKAEAFRLLKGLFDDRRQAMVAELTDPVSRRVTNYFQRVSGFVQRSVRFDDSLQPAAIDTPDAEEISPDLLSTGAQEQLYILTRLALAKYLAEEHGPMLFVVDDTLVNTDQVRHQRFVELLERASSNLQILMMTCHPERYRGIKGATYHGIGQG